MLFDCSSVLLDEYNAFLFSKIRCFYFGKIRAKGCVQKKPDHYSARRCIKQITARTQCNNNIKAPKPIICVNCFLFLVNSVFLGMLSGAQEESFRAKNNDAFFSERLRLCK